MEYSKRQRTFHSISMDGARTPGLDLQIHANVPNFSTLLIPIKKALNSTGFLTFSKGIPKPNSLG
ncbi:hypothetical protein C1H46_024091 [Malus baccata]|uniref:Uncharacterized protein n=1 Tax=Malus baccata TaxID=106549 RepID=A0A540LVB7_MALBA|nr:hypothetical protein C1H46_024091 [Malus baccata]